MIKYLGLLFYWFVLVSTELANAGVHKAYILELKDAIGPATADYLIQGMTRAEAEGGHMVIIKLDTPGGLYEATRDIIQTILELSVPVIVYVAPDGARADSAGTYILYASHIAVMAPTTHLGAATPVALEMPWSEYENPSKAQEDQQQSQKKSGIISETDDKQSANGSLPESSQAPHPNAMARKQINDALAYIRSLAERRGRNIEWAEKAVTQALTLSAQQALEAGVIEYIAQDMDELLAQIDGHTVQVKGRDYMINSAAIEIETIHPDWRNQFLATITNPNIAYILLLLGIYGLFFEVYNPGIGLPGVVGAISLLLALYAFQLLPISYVGLGLMLLGIGLIVVESLVPSFGVFGLGGSIAFVIGSIILMDTTIPAFQIALPVIAAVSLLTVLYFLLVLSLMLKIRNLKVTSGINAMIGETVEALESFEHQGKVLMDGEIWAALSENPVTRGQKLKISAVQGLKLIVVNEEAVKW